jgi:hypothetical protein
MLEVPEFKAVRWPTAPFAPRGLPRQRRVTLKQQRPAIRLRLETETSPQRSLGASLTHDEHQPPPVQRPLHLKLPATP